MKFLETIDGSGAVARLLNLIQQPAILLNVAGDITYCNPAFNTLFGAEFVELGNNSLMKFVDQHESAPIKDFLGDRSANFEREMKVDFTCNDRSVELVIKPLTTADDGKMVFVGLSDVAQEVSRQELDEAKAGEKRLQIALEHESRHDALTGLANRRKLVEDQDAIFEYASKTDATPAYAVMRIDLDRFKQINDDYGHTAADALLVHVSDIFTRLTGDKGSVARMGGDEFSILLTRERRERELLKIAEQIIEEVGKPFYFKGTAMQFGVNIGIASSACQGADPSQTQINADQALYEAKESGRNCIRFFSERFVDEEEYYGT